MKIKPQPYADGGQTDGDRAAGSASNDNRLEPPPRPTDSGSGAHGIRRPIFATVLSIIITVIGLVAMGALPIEQYPIVVPPTVSVQAPFPGANAETVAQTVAAPTRALTLTVRR